MKILALLSLSLAFAIPEAQGEPTSQTEQLETLHQVSINGQSTKYTGLLKLDFAGRRIQLRIVKGSCADLGQAVNNLIACHAMPVQVDEISVPLERVNDHCGSEIYSGQSDNSASGGELLEIEAADHSQRICGDFISPIFQVKATKYVPILRTTITYELTR